jgi:DNA-binding FadR family transcriptional regulator
VNRGPDDPASTAIDRRSFPEEVADGIRRFIAQQQLEPGDRVGREEDLAQRLGVSRPTVREALRLLGSSHLIRVSKGPGGGIFVAATPEQSVGRMLSAAIVDMESHERVDLEEMLQAQALFELPLVRLAAERATPSDLRRLRSLLEEEDGLSMPEAGTVIALDSRFHRLVGEIAGNGLATILLEWVPGVLHPAIERRLPPGIALGPMAENHRAIVAAMAEADPDLAEEAMRGHLLFLAQAVGAATSHPHLPAVTARKR